MKMLAIADNGSRLKDFIDIAYLSSLHKDKIFEEEPSLEISRGRRR